MGAGIRVVTDITADLCQGVDLVLSRMAQSGGKNASSWSKALSGTRLKILNFHIE